MIETQDKSTFDNLFTFEDHVLSPKKVPVWSAILGVTDPVNRFVNAAIVLPGGQAFVGASYCDDADTFNPTKGRDIAIGRAVQKYYANEPTIYLDLSIKTEADVLEVLERNGQNVRKLLARRAEARVLRKLIGQFKGVKPYAR